MILRERQFYKKFNSSLQAVLDSHVDIAKIVAGIYLQHRVIIMVNVHQFIDAEVIR